MQKRGYVKKHTLERLNDNISIDNLSAMSIRHSFRDRAYGGDNYSAYSYIPFIRPAGSFNGRSMNERDHVDTLKACKSLSFSVLFVFR
jgi:hypothetical protein